MIKNVVSTLGGVENFGIISICLFFTVFIVAVLWALFQRKAHVHHMEILPLDGGELKKGESRNE